MINKISRCRLTRHVWSCMTDACLYLESQINLRFLCLAAITSLLIVKRQTFDLFWPFGLFTHLWSHWSFLLFLAHFCLFQPFLPYQPLLVFSAFLNFCPFMISLALLALFSLFGPSWLFWPYLSFPAKSSFQSLNWPHLEFSTLFDSDESEPSWLEPELELKDFQLGSARLVAFSPSARNRKWAKNEPKF